MLAVISVEQLPHFTKPHAWDILGLRLLLLEQLDLQQEEFFEFQAATAALGFLRILRCMHLPERVGSKWKLQFRPNGFGQTFRRTELGMRQKCSNGLSEPG